MLCNSRETSLLRAQHCGLACDYFRQVLFLTQTRLKDCIFETASDLVHFSRKALTAQDLRDETMLYTLTRQKRFVFSI